MFLKKAVLKILENVTNIELHHRQFLGNYSKFSKQLFLQNICKQQFAKSNSKLILSEKKLQYQKWI